MKEADLQAVALLLISHYFNPPQEHTLPSFTGSGAETGAAYSLDVVLCVTICHGSSKIRVGKGLNIVDVILFWIWWLC